MIQIAPQMRVLAAIEPADFRQGIDGLAQLCRARLHDDPFSGAIFVFRNRGRTAVKALIYDGQGFWLCHKRLSSGRFRWWPPRAGGPAAPLRPHELAVLLSGGDPSAAGAVPDWRAVAPGEKSRV